MSSPSSAGAAGAFLHGSERPVAPRSNGGMGYPDAGRPDGVTPPAALLRSTTPPLLREYRARAELQGLGRVGTSPSGGKLRKDQLECVEDPFLPCGSPSAARSKQQQQREARELAREQLLVAEELDKGQEDGYLSSPNSLTACQVSSSSFSASAKLRDLNLNDAFSALADGPCDTAAGAAAAASEAAARRKAMFFSTGLFAHDLIDAAQHPPEYKEQYTVTGQMRRVKLKRQGPVLGHKVELNGQTVAVFRYKGGVYAIANKCCHQGGPLFQGDIEDMATPAAPLDGPPTRRRPPRPQPCVACPWHGWKFDLDTGRCLHKDDYSQLVFPTKVERGEIFVGFYDIDQSVFDGSADDF